jgi:hypothetical protein
MSIINEIIRAEADGSLSFGDYESVEKKKAKIEQDGNEYHVKTHGEITRLEKNGMLLLETVPGTVVHNLNVTADAAAFSLEGREDTRITLELEPDEMYRVLINGTNIGNVKSNMSGKVVFSMELDATYQSVEVKKV